MLLTVGWRLNAGQAYEALQLQLSRQRLPEWLGILDVEGDVDLQYAGLTGLPESVGELAVSGDLRLAHNALAALPESFGEISVGGMLKLSHNRLETKDDLAGLVLCPSITTLDVQQNQIDDPAGGQVDGRLVELAGAGDRDALSRARRRRR